MLINAIVPAILLPAGLLLARLMPLQTAQRERTRIVTTIQDGQLGWLALAWSAATVYEAWDMDAKGHVFGWVAVLLASETIVVLTAMFIAAGGAVTADTSTNRSTRLSASINVASMSAMLFHCDAPESPALRSCYVAFDEREPSDHLDAGTGAHVRFSSQWPRRIGSRHRKLGRSVVYESLIRNCFG